MSEPTADTLREALRGVADPASGRDAVGDIHVADGKIVDGLKEKADRVLDAKGLVAAGPATGRLARELGVGLRLGRGTARGGRVTQEDGKAYVRQLAADGVAVLFFISELSEIQLACDRVLVMYEGKIAAQMPAQDADEAALLHAAHGLTSEEVMV